MSIGFDIFFEKISLFFTPFCNMGIIVTRFFEFVKKTFFLFYEQKICAVSNFAL